MVKRGLLALALVMIIIGLLSACGARGPSNRQVESGGLELPNGAVTLPPMEWPPVNEPAPEVALEAFEDDRMVAVPSDFEGRALALMFFSLG
ncbi:MAG: hypothetical protein H0Z39_02755 [Peptococcaceae bacterium]|nr:hypothetical protein [Peptococcaceae bacterium]